jgi:hypothetical protein
LFLFKRLMLLPFSIRGLGLHVIGIGQWNS